MSIPNASRGTAARPTFQPSALARAARITALCAAAPALVYPLMAQAQATNTTDASASSLPNITVSAERRETATTEHQRTFAAKKATVGKTAQELRDIPQPVTVLTREYLDQRQFFDLTDILQNTAGVTVDYTDSERVTYHSRGYQIDALQIDGLTINQFGSIFIQPDAAVLDRVEVLRGASGMLRGSGNPSAAVNMVRKRPTNEFQASVEATLGSWDRRRLVGDISTPLNASGSVRGRLVAVTDKKEFFQKAREEDRKVAYGVLEADLTPRTKLTTSLQYTDLNATGAWGSLPDNLDGSALNLPRDTYLGSDWNRWNRYNQQAFAELEHRFDNDWNLKFSAEYTRMRMKLNGFKQTYFARPSGATNPYLMNVTTAQYSGDAIDQRALNVTANGPFTLFGRKHELVIGAESLNSKNVATTGNGNQNPTPTPIDIRNWNPYTSYPETNVVMPTTTGAPTYIQQQGVYATTKLSITDPLDVLIGARMSWWKTEQPRQASSPTGFTTNYSIAREVTPYIGATYEITKSISAYAGYTEIFSPQSNVNANREVISPIRGEDIEAGLKGVFFDGKLNASVSLFRIENVGKAIEDTSTPKPCTDSQGTIYASTHCYMADGKTRSEGWELELAGEVLPGWQVMGGYTNTRTSYVKDSTAANVGTPLRSQDPRHVIKLFTSYRLGGALQGLTVGGGAQSQSGTYVKGDGRTAQQGGYTVYNAMASYQINKTYSVQLNVNNLFDKVYYKKYAPWTSRSAVGYYYGDPLNAMLTLRAAF